VNSQESTTDQILKVVALANREGLYDAADWFMKWQTANLHNQRYRSLAGDFWNLAHGALEALGAYDESDQEWHVERIKDEDDRLLAAQLIQAIEEYDALSAKEQERAVPAGRIHEGEEG
jgi:hypothetical protein